jgi:hypothetical protein
MKSHTGMTTKILVAASAALIAYDLYAAATPEQGDTISEVVARASRRRPIIAFAAGVIMGHFFWQMGEEARENAGPA